MSEPLSRFIPGPGIFTSRTDWTKSAQQLLFVAGLTTESHQDRSQGAFFFAQGADWLVSTAKDFSHSGIRQDAVDYACLTVNGQRQTQTQNGCRYLKQEDTALYSYLVADLTAAYQGQLTAYTRELFWIKGGPLLVRDVFTPADPAAVVTWNLNVLTAPVVDPGGFRLTADGGSQLFGAAGSPFTASLVPLEPAQTRPTARLTLTGSEFLVGLEPAPAAQAARTVALLPFNVLRGIFTPKSMVAAVNIGPPFTYVSPATGTHFLYGLKSGAAYQVSRDGSPFPIAATPAGVLAFSATSGQSVTVAVAAPLPPKGRTFSLFVPADGSAPTVSEVPS